MFTADTHLGDDLVEFDVEGVCAGEFECACAGDESLVPDGSGHQVPPPGVREKENRAPVVPKICTMIGWSGSSNNTFCTPAMFFWW